MEELIKMMREFGITNEVAYIDIGGTHSSAIYRPHPDNEGNPSWKFAGFHSDDAPLDIPGDDGGPWVDILLDELELITAYPNKDGYVVGFYKWSDSKTYTYNSELGTYI